MNRRRFFVSGAAAALAATGVALPRAMRPNGRAAPVLPALYTVVFDTRFPASRDFGAAAARAGRRTAGIQGDITALWLEDLRVQWALARGAIAGMTTMPSFFCLQQLAKDHWMHVVVSAEHRRPDSHADARRVREFVDGRGLDRIAPADGKLVSWVIAA
jgi:hypothetical protein